ncbi:MAG TPA: protein translocase subunit SecD [Chloroflexota bacterium]
MRRRNPLVLGGIALLFLVSLWIVWPQEPSRYLPGFIPWPKSQGIHVNVLGFTFDRQGFRLGLDLQGGTHLVLKADLSRVEPAQREDALRGVLRVIERRINAYGVAEPIVQAQGSERVIVELPGVKDIEEAKRLIGQTAQLDFREMGADGSWVPAKAIGNDGQEHELTGRFFRKAEVAFDPTTGRPVILFEFNDEGAKLFADITTRNVGRPIAIFLDDELLTAPTVREPITQGRGQIEGSFTVDEARNLVIQLNAGALPVPVQIEEERSVDATLGSDSVQKSIVAGQVGFLAVVLFMVLYYRLPGLLASLALVLYATLTLAIFKLVPVTLTLAGIAGFILSVGMAVDANILIFERMREELRRGQLLGPALESGFKRAWSSIRDSNVSTLITCGILYVFGSNLGASIVMGFALTLAIGVVVSMFSAIIVSRSLLRALLGTGLVRHEWLFGMHVPEATSSTAAAVSGHLRDARSMEKA